MKSISRYFNAKQTEDKNIKTLKNDYRIKKMEKEIHKLANYSETHIHRVDALKRMYDKRSKYKTSKGQKVYRQKGRKDKKTNRKKER